MNDFPFVLHDAWSTQQTDSTSIVCHPRATLRMCSTSSFRSNAAAAVRRRPGGAPPARANWRVKADEPHLITPRVDPGVPVLSLGRYAGARREAIVAVKEHGRADLIAPLAVALHSRAGAPADVGCGRAHR